jgi:hypothetical protein
MKKASKRDHCKCNGKWTFVRVANKNTGLYSDVVRKVRHAIKLAKPSNIGEAIELALQEYTRYTIPLRKSPGVIPIPKKGTEISTLVPMFVGLVATGMLQGNADVIMNAVNNTSNAVKELAVDRRATIDVEISENINLRLYKSDLALYTKT